MKFIVGLAAAAALTLGIGMADSATPESKTNIAQPVAMNAMFGTSNPMIDQIAYIKFEILSTDDVAALTAPSIGYVDGFDHVAHVSKMPASVADIKINGNDNMNVASLINGRYDSGAIIASNDQKKIGSDGHGHAPFAGVQARIAKIGSIDLGLGVGHKPPLGLLPA